ncbi:MAG: amidohydrolase, partial [Planctomycetota bacterium]
MVILQNRAAALIANPDNTKVLNLDSLIRIRRHLHQHPEVSGEEFQTTLFLAEQLGDAGIPFLLGPEQRGLIVDLGNTSAADKLAIRADIDAIPVQDLKDVDYQSQNKGAMHACGHDAHSTILLGTIFQIQQHLSRMPSERGIRCIFQPEEETAVGASRLIQAGVLNNVGSIVAVHVDPNRPTGRIGLRNGTITAHCTEINVTVTGRGGHAARPREAIDPIEVAVDYIHECYRQIPRERSEDYPVVLSITAFHGGESNNVVPETVKLTGTMRSLDQSARQDALNKMSTIAHSLEQLTGAQIDLRFGLVVPSVVADEKMNAFIAGIAGNTLGSDKIDRIPEPSMGGEDFSFYCERVPASFIRLGCRGEQQGHLPLHNPHF